MKHFSRRSLARALIGGGRRHLSMAAVVRRLENVELRHQQGGACSSTFYWRRMSNLAPVPAKEKQKEKSVSEEKKSRNADVSSYWEIKRPKVNREDGTEWPWNSFMPWETYHADVSIDVTKHYEPKTFLDKVALTTVKFLRLLSDLYFKERHGCHATMVETILAVPGLVGGTLLHLKSLRKFQQSGGWIRALLEEAENERIHLMTMMEIAKPRWHERLLVLAAQGVFFNAYFVLYMVSPKAAHRFVGYLEEEAVVSYSKHLKAIESGRVEDVPAPAIAVDYWRLPMGATLRDVITVIRADQAHHRDVNHFASDTHYEGKELREAPAPLGYH